MKSKTDLFVEGNPSGVELTKRSFVQGHITNDLTVVQDGQEALDYLFCAGKYAGWALTDMPALSSPDVKLPRVDGLEFLRRVRSNESTRRLPVVVLTPSKEEHDLGVNSYISKPVDFHQFADAIKHLGLYWLVINEPLPIA